MDTDTGYNCQASGLTFQPMLFLWSGDVSEGRPGCAKTSNEPPHEENKDARRREAKERHGRRNSN